MKQKLRLFTSLLLLAVASAAWGDVYKFTISTSDFNTTSYAANNNEKTSLATSTTDESKTIEVTWISNQVMQSSQTTQWQKNAGCIYNKTDLGTITNIKITSSAGTFTTYYGDEMEPSSNTTVGGGFFQIKVGSVTGKTSTIEVTFERDDSQPSVKETTTTISRPESFNTDIANNLSAGQLFASVCDEDGTPIDGASITWSSETPNVATVDDYGNVTLVERGIAKIKATYNGVTNEYRSSFAICEFEVINSDIYDVTFNAGIDTSEDLTLSKGGITMTLSEGTLSRTDNYRLYVGGNITFTSTVGNITSIVFSAEQGNLTGDDYNKSLYTWSGNSKSVVLSQEGSQFRFTKVIVTYEPLSENKTASPTISGTTPFLGSTEVTIAATPETAKVYYTLDGTDPTISSTEYTGPFTINATTTVKAIAKDGDKEESEIVTKEFEKTESFSLGELNTKTDGTYYVEFDNAVVTYVNNPYTFIQDNTGAVMLYKYNAGYTAGQVLNGIGQVDFYVHQGQPEIKNITGIEATNGDPVEPKVVTLSKLTANPIDYMSKFIKVEGVEVDAEGNLKQGESTFAFYGRNDASVEAGKKYDVIGFVGKHNESYQLVVYTPEHVSEVVEASNLAFIDEGGEEVTTYEMYVNDEATISINCEIENAVVVVESTDSENNIIYYDEETNTLMAMGPGTATLTANAVADDEEMTVLATATLTVNVSKMPVVVSFNNPTTKVNVNEFVANVATANVDNVTIVYSSSNEDVALVDENGKVGGVTPGKATITASIQETDAYDVTTASYEITVVDPSVQINGYKLVTSTADVTDGEYLIVWKDETMALAFNGGLETLDAAGNSIGVTVVDDVVESNGTTDAAAFTIATVEGGYSIKSASGYYIGQTSNANGMAASTNNAYTNTISFDEDGNANIVSSGGAYLRYNATSGQNRFRYFKSSTYAAQKAIQLYKKVETTPETESVTVGKAGYTTYVTKKNVAIPEGVEVYIVTAIHESSIHMDRVTGAIPANTPVVVKASEGTHGLPIAESATDISGNLLQASDGDVTGDGSTIYALGVGKVGDANGKVGFYRVKSNVIVPEGKAYLVIPASVSVRDFIGFDDETDGIRQIENGQLTIENAEIYNLSGQRVNKAQKGIYIVNGKKVVIR